jgi:hypothetical protein
MEARVKYFLMDGNRRALAVIIVIPTHVQLHKFAIYGPRLNHNSIHIRNASTLIHDRFAQEGSLRLSVAVKISA